MFLHSQFKLYSTVREFLTRYSNFKLNFLLRFMVVESIFLPTLVLQYRILSTVRLVSFYLISQRIIVYTGVGDYSLQKGDVKLSWKSPRRSRYSMSSMRQSPGQDASLCVHPPPDTINSVHRWRRICQHRGIHSSRCLCQLLPGFLEHIGELALRGIWWHFDMDWSFGAPTHPQRKRVRQCQPTKILHRVYRNVGCSGDHEIWRR